MNAEFLSAADLAAMSDDALVAYAADLTATIEAAPASRDARLVVWNEARGRTPPISFARLADASGMTTSGVINGLRARTEKDHSLGRHKRKAVPGCHLCGAGG